MYAYHVDFDYEHYPQLRHLYRRAHGLRVIVGHVVDRQRDVPRHGLAASGLRRDIDHQAPLGCSR